MKSKNIGQFKFFFSNKEEFENIYQEIFLEKEYYFKFKHKNPTIIDCGSHIGISIHFFKSIYPKATILGFEPDPNNFILLQKNITKNKLSNIFLINKAVWSKNGHSTLYGFTNKDTSGWSWDNSLVPNIWSDKNVKNKFSIQTCRLSEFINTPIDLLKLDIEGSEAKVVKEILSKLKFVNNLYIEFHGTPNTHRTNNYFSLIKLLIKNNFVVKSYLKDGSEFTPDINFLKAHNPCVFLLRATKH